VEYWFRQREDEDGNQDESDNDRRGPNRASKVRHTNPADNEKYR
jgi:hypothetical protein